MSRVINGVDGMKGKYLGKIIILISIIFLCLNILLCVGAEEETQDGDVAQNRGFSLAADVTDGFQSAQDQASAIRHHDSGGGRRNQVTRGGALVLECTLNRTLPPIAEGALW